jgi:hypothetical protein
LSIYDPTHFASAHHWGGFAVRLFILATASWTSRTGYSI